MSLRLAVLHQLCSVLTCANLCCYGLSRSICFRSWDLQAHSVCSLDYRYKVKAYYRY